MSSIWRLCKNCPYYCSFMVLWIVSFFQLMEVKEYEDIGELFHIIFDSHSYHLDNIHYNINEPNWIPTIMSYKTSDSLRCKKEKPEIYMPDHEKGLIKRLKQKSCPKNVYKWITVSTVSKRQTPSESDGQIINRTDLLHNLFSSSCCENDACLGFFYVSDFSMAQPTLAENYMLMLKLPVKKCIIYKIQVRYSIKVC